MKNWVKPFLVKHLTEHLDDPIIDDEQKSWIIESLEEELQEDEATCWPAPESDTNL